MEGFESRDIRMKEAQEMIRRGSSPCKVFFHRLGPILERANAERLGYCSTLVLHDWKPRVHSQKNNHAQTKTKVDRVISNHLEGG